MRRCHGDVRYLETPDGAGVVEEALALADTLDVLYVPHVHRMVAVDTRDFLLEAVVRDGDRVGIARVLGQ